MGLTCQLLGHQFGEPTTERMREERGGEMVTTEREVRVCARCGDRLVISQNTEVVAIRTTGSGDADLAPERTAHGGDPHLDDIIDPSLRSTPTPRSATDADPPDPQPRPTVDSAAEPASSRGTGALDPGPADPADEDAEILDGSTPTSDQPEEPPDPETDETAAAHAGDSREARVDTVTSVPSATGSVDTIRDPDAHVDVADLPDEAVEFYCPACGYAVVATLTSMRSGDICPACREGYIAERARRQ
jgi:hypothetical protein